MSKTTFSLSWESHRNNICNGITGLQQSEEFVDMTLAADGHFVKVHQMIMALASPYFKDLISSAAGRHPVIFLNNISYSTLSAILEYIYTGEVLISIDNLTELIQTAKELHIKGLEDMKLQSTLNNAVKQIQTQEKPEPEKSSLQGFTENKEFSEMDDEICYFEITDRDDTQTQRPTYSTLQLDGTLNDTNTVQSIEMDENDEEMSVEEAESNAVLQSKYHTQSESYDDSVSTSIQYTVSNQGSIQMILNRYLYYLKHSNRNNTRQWRCVDYLNKNKCPAVVMTRNNIALQRLFAHIHGHHDKRILKKVQAGAIYTEIQDAEVEGHNIKSKVKQEKTERDTNSTNTNVNLVTQSESCLA